MLDWGEDQEWNGLATVAAIWAAVGIVVLVVDIGAIVWSGESAAVSGMSGESAAVSGMSGESLV